MSAFQSGRLVTSKYQLVRTATAYIASTLLIFIPLYIVEDEIGIAVPYAGSFIVLLFIFPLSIGLVALIVFCSSRELVVDGECIDEPRPPWQPTLVLGLALPLLAALLDKEAGLPQFAVLAWVGIVLGGSAGLANWFIRNWNGYRDA